MVVLTPTNQPTNQPPEKVIKDNSCTDACAGTPPKAPETTPPKVPETTPPKAPETTPPKAPETTPPKAPETTPPKAPETPAKVPEIDLKTYSGRYWSLIGSGEESRSYSDYLTGSLTQLIITERGGSQRVVDLAEVNHTGNSSLEHSRFGVYVDPVIKGESTFMYSVGAITPSDKMPTDKGVISYKGSAFYGNEQSEGMTKLNADFSVNFQQKSVDGHIYSTVNKLDIKLPTAKIEGSHFYNKFGGSPHISGYFYGDNAQELGGIYTNEGEDEMGEIAVFGATKQK